jgi:hypothetical protein
VTTPLPKGSGFSGHACGNPLRYVPKAPPEPEEAFHQNACTGESITGNSVFDSFPGLNLLVRLTSDILPGEGLLSRTGENIRLSRNRSSKGIYGKERRWQAAILPSLKETTV